MGNVEDWVFARLVPNGLHALSHLIFQDNFLHKHRLLKNI